MAKVQNCSQLPLEEGELNLSVQYYVPLCMNKKSTILLPFMEWLVVSVELDIQVDDKHVMYSDGQFVSQGDYWSQVYSIVVGDPKVLAFYAENVSALHCILLHCILIHGSIVL